MRTATTAHMITAATMMPMISGMVVVKSNRDRNSHITNSDSLLPSCITSSYKLRPVRFAYECIFCIFNYHRFIGILAFLVFPPHFWFSSEFDCHYQNSGQIVTTNKPIPNFLQAWCPSCRPTNRVKALEEKYHIMDSRKRYYQCTGLVQCFAGYFTAKEHQIPRFSRTKLMHYRCATPHM